MSFLSDEGVLLKKHMLEKAATIKRFEYLSLGSELKKQTDIAKKQYQVLDKICEFDKENDFKKLTNKAKRLAKKMKK